MNRIMLFSSLALALVLLVGQVSSLSATSREVLIEDLTIGNIDDDIHHRPERPGKVVRVVPWIDADGRYTVLAVTEVGWVFQAHEVDEWVLVGRVYDSAPLRRGTGLNRY